LLERADAVSPDILVKKPNDEIVPVGSWRSVEWRRMPTFGENRILTPFLTRAIRTHFYKAGDFAANVPLPATVRKSLSKGDFAFIVAACAIPLPGTGLLAAAIVVGRLGCKHLRRLLRPATR
jgi:hypothetical protein